MTTLHVVGEPAPEPEVSQFCIEELERLLQEARAGRVVQVGIAVVMSDGGIRRNFAAGKNQHYAALIGAIEHLKQCVLEDMRSYDR